MQTTARAFGADLLGQLRLGLRLALFRRPADTTPPASWSQFVALAGIGLAIPLAVDMFAVGPQGTLNPYALPGAVFHLVPMLFAAWALAMLAGRSERTLDLLVAIAALWLPIDVVDRLLGAFLPLAASGLPAALLWLPGPVTLLWQALAALVAAVRLLGLAEGRRLAGAGVACLGLGLPPYLVSHTNSLWVAPYDAAAAAESERRQLALVGEDSFYLQPQLLERALAALAPGRKGVVDLYFVGAAGDSSQDVFMKEMHSVARLFEERFDTAGRSVMLINNPKTVAESPIASTTSLARTLRRVGEVMDRDEDILFLFLTSHGSADHHFQLDFWPLRFNTLDPQALRRMLDASGITRRVIVVSACYAGGFIDALRDENTLVIAAAAPDKTSFGCSNEADFTYFGKAYFDEALRHTDSFVEAFEIARPVIAERERQEAVEHSDPRIHVGAGIRRVLDDFRHGRQPAAAALAGATSAPSVAGSGAVGSPTIGSPYPAAAVRTSTEHAQEVPLTSPALRQSPR